MICFALQSICLLLLLSFQRLSPRGHRIYNNNNKYKTYIAHIQDKYFHMHITDYEIKIISQLKKKLP